MAVTQVQRRAETVVVIEWVLFALGIIGSIIFMVLAWIYYDAIVDYISNGELEEQDETDQNQELAKRIPQSLKRSLTVVGIIALVINLINFVLVHLLSQGVHSRHRVKVNIWYIVNIIIFGLGLLEFLSSLFNAFSGNNSGSGSLASLAGNVIGLVYRGVSLKIIKNFLLELDLGPKNEVVYSYVTNDFIKV